MNLILKRFFSAAAILTAFFIFESCGDDSVNATQDFVRGTITFQDVNFTFGTGYYAVSVYSNVTNPFSNAPVASDSVDINMTNRTAYYDISGLPSAHYIIGATWINASTGNVDAVLGSYGCDTVRTCTNHTPVEVPRYEGNANLNFYSWGSVSKRIYP